MKTIIKKAYRGGVEKPLFTGLALSLVFLFNACRSDSGEIIVNNEKSKIQVLSPTRDKIEYNYVTLEIQNTLSDVQVKNTSDNNNTSYIGVKNNSSFLIYNVPLKKGANIIEVSGDGGKEKFVMTLNSEGKGTPPIGLESKLKNGFEKLATTIEVNSDIADASEYLFDNNGDGIIDEQKSEKLFNVNYNKEGKFLPIVTVKTDENFLYSSQPYLALDVKSKPISTTIPSLQSLSIVDMQTNGMDSNYLFTGDSVQEVNSTSNTIIKNIPIANMNNADGFFVDMDDNIWVANTGDNKIVKFDKTKNYQATLTFGKAGSAKEELNQPKDIVVSGKGEEQKIYVLDAGNNRIQVFDYLGVWLYSFDGSTTPTGKLKNPTSMIGYYEQPLFIVDSGNKAIRVLQCSMGSEEHEVSVIKENLSSDIGKISLDSSLIVPDKGNKKIFLFNPNGNLRSSIPMDKVPNMATSLDNYNFFVSYVGENGLSKVMINIDPKGAEPIDKAKEFVSALIANDRAKVESILLGKQKLIDMIYDDPNNTKIIIEAYKHVVSYEQTYFNSSYSKVKMHIKNGTEEFDTSFDLRVADYSADVWTISALY